MPLSGSHFSIKIVGIFVTNKRWPHGHFIFIVEIPLLERQHFNSSSDGPWSPFAANKALNGWMGSPKNEGVKRPLVSSYSCPGASLGIIVNTSTVIVSMTKERSAWLHCWTHINFEGDPVYSISADINPSGCPTRYYEISLHWES